MRDACWNDMLDEVKGLIEEGVDVDSKGENGWTPLLIAILKGNVGIVRLLLDHGANINYRPHNRYTAIHHAACHGEETVRILIERGANLHVKNYLGKTPLDYAKESFTATIIERAIKSTKGKKGY